MLLSEFIENCQEILEKEGDGVDFYKYFEPEIDKDEVLNCYIIF